MDSATGKRSLARRLQHPIIVLSNNPLFDAVLRSCAQPSYLTPHRLGYYSAPLCSPIITCLDEQDRVSRDANGRDEKTTTTPLSQRASERYNADHSVSGRCTRRRMATHTALSHSVRDGRRKAGHRYMSVLVTPRRPALTGPAHCPHANGNGRTSAINSIGRLRLRL